MQAKIVVKNLSKSFGAKRVLNQVNLDIGKNESLVIIGGSGSGKSVLIKCILGLMTPDLGSHVEVDGQSVIEEPHYLLRRSGMAFQGGALFDSLRIWENITFSLMQNRGVSSAQARMIAKEKLEVVGLSERTLDLYPSEISGGMQKRVALARTIADDPEVIFFDEPTSGLDPITAQVITDLIDTLSKGATTLTITHDMRCVEQIGDRVAMIYDGKIIWHDQGGKLYNSGNPYVDQFIRGATDGPIQLL
jgi:phospholipid/cholesterol/gamma-HCH transport system ATP-binding protein